MEGSRLQGSGNARRETEHRSSTHFSAFESEFIVMHNAGNIGHSQALRPGKFQLVGRQDSQDSQQQQHARNHSLYVSNLQQQAAAAAEFIEAPPQVLSIVCMYGNKWRCILLRCQVNPYGTGPHNPILNVVPCTKLRTYAQRLHDCRGVGVARYVL